MSAPDRGGHRQARGRAAAPRSRCGARTCPCPARALPEAPASVNVRLMIEGRDCQVTLRDSDEGRLLVRLQAVLAQYPVLAPTAQPEGWCAVHNIQMRLNPGKDGKPGW